MGKRGAVAAPAASKVAKHHKVQKDPFEEACAPVLTFLSGAELPEECQDMLCLAAPHAFRTYRDDRHKFQVAIVEKVGDLLTQVHHDTTEALAKAEAECTTIAQEQASLGSDLVAQQGVVDTKLEHSKQQEGALADAANELRAASEALASARDEVSMHAERVKTREVEKQSYEAAVTELWEPLKTGVKDSRERNKRVSDFLRLLGKCGTPPSLMQALGIVLKGAAANRGEFANITVEYGEKALQGHLEKLAAEQGSSKFDAAALAQAVGASEENVTRAQAAKYSQMSETATSENAWADEVGILNAIKAKVDSAVPRSKALGKALDQAKAAHASHCELMSRFDALRDRQAPAPETIEEAPEAPPATETPVPVESNVD